MPGTKKNAQRGIVLIAHGSRDPGAEAEGRRLRAALAKARPSCAFALAYLNREPSLSAAVEALCEKGCGRIEVFPLLVFQGKHAGNDLPALVAREKSRRPGLPLRLRPHLSKLQGFATLLARSLDDAPRGKRG